MTSNVIQIRLGCKSDTVLIPHSIFENSVQEKGKNVQHIQVVGQNQCQAGKSICIAVQMRLRKSEAIRPRTDEPIKD